METGDRTVLAQRIPALTSIRFFAAAWVVLFHAQDDLRRFLPEGIVRAFSRGSQGVSLFFVLSGFILAHTYWDRRIKGSAGLCEYAVHRFARIVPLYLLSLLISVPVLRFAAETAPVRYAYAHPWLTAISHLTLMHEWFYWPVLVLNSPTWSVGTEVGFYLLFPCLLPLVRGLSARTALFGIVAMAVLISLFPLLFLGGGVVDLGVPAEQAIRMWPLFRLPEFILGMLLVPLARGTVWDALKRSGLDAMIVVGILTLVASFVVSAPRTSLLVEQVLPVPFFAAGILRLALAGERSLGWLTSPSLLLCGEASYALYLFHVPTMEWVRLLAAKFGHAPSSLVVVIAVLLAPFVVALAAHRFVEGPARRWLVARYAPRRSAANASA